MQSVKLGRKIKLFRQRASMSQLDLELEVDAAAGSISRIENGLINPTKETLKKLSQALRLSVSEEAYLFEIDLYPATPLAVASNTQQLEVLWRHGDLEALFGLLNRELRTLSIDDLLWLARVTLETGRTSQTKKVLDNIYQKTENNPSAEISHLCASLIESELHIMNDAFESAKRIINNVLIKAVIYKNQFLLGKSYFLLGLIDSQTKSVAAGIEKIEKSIEYYDVIHHPMEIGKSYLFLTDFFEYREDYLGADKYYAKSKEMFESLANQYYLGWWTGGKSFSEYIRGNFKEAAPLAREAIKIDSASGSLKQLYYSKSLLAKIFLAEGNYEEADRCFAQSLSLERKFRQDVVTSGNNLYMLFIRAKDSSEHLRSLESVLSSAKPQDNTKSYLLHTAKYLFGQTDDVRSKGEEGLKKLNADTVYPQFRRTIENTLVQKSVQPLAV